MKTAISGMCQLNPIREKLMEIPFNRPYLTGNELSYIEDAMQSSQSGGHISGDGKYTKLVLDTHYSELPV